ncbi:MAG: hypothetical protein V1787_00620 [Candidatus Micrarchaeota archaeon]
MKKDACYACPSGCEVRVSGGKEAVVPQIWDHLVLFHGSESVSFSDVLAVALSPIA